MKCSHIMIVSFLVTIFSCIMVVVVTGTIVYVGTILAPTVIPTTIPAQTQIFDARQSVVPIVTPEIGAGSGCIIAQTEQHWYIGTARHVVEGQPVLIVDWRVAELVVMDDKYDLAILRIPHTGQNYRILLFGKAQMGQSVRSYGFHWQNNLYAPELMLMVGHISCLDFDGFYTTNGGLFPGSSGGPLLNKSRELLGIASRVPVVWGHPNHMVACFVPSKYLQELLVANLEGVQ